MSIPTVRIVHPDVPGGMLINESDFDAGVHVRYDDAVAAQQAAAQAAAEAERLAAERARLEEASREEEGKLQEEAAPVDAAAPAVPDPAAETLVDTEGAVDVPRPASRRRTARTA